MYAGGIPTEDEKHVYNAVKASLEIRDYIISKNEFRKRNNLPPWEICIGINTGPVVAGVAKKEIRL